MGDGAPPPPPPPPPPLPLPLALPLPPSPHTLLPSPVKYTSPPSTTRESNALATCDAACAFSVTSPRSECAM